MASTVLKLSVFCALIALGACARTLSGNSAVKPTVAAPPTPRADALSAELVVAIQEPDAPIKFRQLRTDAPKAVREYYAHVTSYEAGQIATIALTRDAGILKTIRSEIDAVRISELEIGLARGLNPTEQGWRKIAIDEHEAAARAALAKYRGSKHAAEFSPIPSRPFQSPSLLTTGDIGTFESGNSLVQIIDPSNALINAKFNDGETRVIWVHDDALAYRLADKATGDSVYLYGEYEVAGTTTYPTAFGSNTVHKLTSISIESYLEAD